MQKIIFWLCFNLILPLSLLSNTFALNVIGTGKNQTEALQNALRNLSEFVSGVHVSTRIEMQKELFDGKVNTSVSDVIRSDSDFYVENVQRFVRQASDTRVVISLADNDVRGLRENYRLWKTRPDIKGSVSIEDGKVTVSLRETEGVPVTLSSYRLKIQTTKASLLCSSWKWDSEKEVSGILAEPVALMDNRAYEFEVELDKRFSFLDIGKNEQINVKVVLEGVDAFGRKVVAEI